MITNPSFLTRLLFFITMAIISFSQVVIAQEKSLVITINGSISPPNDTLCQPNALALMGSVGGGPGPITFPNPRWTGSGAAYLSTTTDDITIFDSNLSGAGIFTLIYSAYDASMTLYSKTKKIVVDGNHNMSIVSPTNGTYIGCVNETVQLKVTGGSSYYWYKDDCNGGGYEFYDEGTSSSIDVTTLPIHTCKYMVLGFSAMGCPTTPESIEFTVTGNAAPVADAGLDVSICAGSSTTLTASGGGSYTWSNGANIATTTVSPYVKTTYTVTVTNANGCSASDAVVVYVNPPPIVNAGTDVTICQGNSTSLTAYGGVSYSWNTGATTSIITVSPIVNTTYTVTVVSSSGCTGIDNVRVTVLSPPTVGISPAINICTGTCSTLTASGGVSYTWSNSDHNASTLVCPAVNTTYTVTVANVAGCTAQRSVFVSLSPTLIALAGSDMTICSSDVGFILGEFPAAIGGTPPLQYTWFSSNLLEVIPLGANPFVQPTVTTTYTLNVTDGNGCMATDEIVIMVNNSPIANAGPDQTIIEGQSATFTASGGDNYSWSTNETTATITVSPNITTTYTVTVSNSYNCSDIDEVVVNVEPLLLLSPYFTTNLSGNIATFNNLSSIRINNFWDFGDGYFANEENPVHTYNSSGYYNVSLSIMDTGGNNTVADYCKRIAVNLNPVCNCDANFSYSSSGLVVNFTNLSIGNLTNYYWDFGDGRISNLSNPSHGFYNAGYFNVKLTVYDSIHNCMSEISKIISVGNVQNDCEANFSYYIDLISNSVHFTNTSLGLNLNNFNWNFGDESVSNLENPVHQYQSIDYFQVCLTASSSLSSCSDITCKTVSTVADNSVEFPSISFIVDTLNAKTLSYPVAFKGSSKGNPVDVLWHYGDGNSEAQNWNPTHVYTAADDYLVSLKTINASGSEKEIFAIVSTTNDENLKARFAYKQEEILQENVYPVKFNGAVFGDPSIIRWQFGDGTIDSNAYSITHTYSSVGDYEVCFIGINPNNGQIDKYCKVIAVIDTINNCNNFYSEQQIFKCYPNPFCDNINISYELKTASNISLEIFDIYGNKKELLINCLQSKGTHQHQFNQSALESGVYVLKLAVNEKIFYKKIIKMN